MSANRHREIILDPLYTDEFLKIHREAEREVVLPFDLPSSPADLHEFLGGVTEKSKKYKEGFGIIIDSLAMWAKEHNIPADVCERFKSNYLDYSGTNDEKNQHDYHVYHEGLTAIVGIFNHINNEKIALDVRRDQISNLFQGMMVCGPGTYTNITNGYYALLAYTNSASYLMEMRKNIAEQLILEMIRDEHRVKVKKLIPEGMEIHYVNGVLNRYSDDVGVPQIEDAYVASCHPNVLERLFNFFKLNIQNELNLYAILLPIYDKLEMGSIKKDILKGGENYVNAIRKLENNLMLLGIEDEKLKFYHVDKIVKLYGDYDDIIKVAWDEKYYLVLSIYSRLVQQGFIQTDDVIKYPLSNNETFCYLPGCSFVVSYIESPDGVIPTMSYFVRKLISQDHEAINHIMTFLKSDIITSNPDDYQEFFGTILIELANYWSSDNFIEESKQDHALEDRVRTAIGRIADFIPLYTPTLIGHMLDYLPQEKWESTVLLLDKSKVEYVYVSMSISKYEETLKILPEEKKLPFLMLMKDQLFKPLSTSNPDFLLSFEDILIRLLPALPPNQQIPFMKSIIEYNPSIINNQLTFVKCLKNLSPNTILPFIEMLGPDKAIKFIRSAPEQDFANLYKVLELVLQSDRLEFIKMLGEEVRVSLINDRKDMHIISKCMSKLNDEQMIQLIDYLGYNNIKSMTDTNQKLIFILSNLSTHQQMTFLKALNFDIYETMCKIGPYILDEHSNSAQLAAILKELKPKEISIILDRFTTHIYRSTNDESNLGKILSALNQRQQKSIIEYLNSERLADIIKDPDRFALIINQLKPESWKSFIELINSKSFSYRDIFNPGYEIVRLLNKLPPNHRIQLIEALGVTIFQDIVVNQPKIFQSVVKQLPEKDKIRLFLLDEIDEAHDRCIPLLALLDSPHYEDLLPDLINLIPYKDRSRLLDASCTSVLSRNIYYNIDLDKINELFPDTEQRSKWYKETRDHINRANINNEVCHEILRLEKAESNLLRTSGKDKINAFYQLNRRIFDKSQSISDILIKWHREYATCINKTVNPLAGVTKLFSQEAALPDSAKLVDKLMNMYGKASNDSNVKLSEPPNLPKPS